MKNIARFWALLKKLPHADKELLVETYSDGATTSLKAFANNNPQGFYSMLTAMQNEVDKQHGKATPKVSENSVEKRRLRSLILRAMQDQGVAVRGGDWSDVNEFVERHAGVGKSLSNMSVEELSKFNRQVHKLLDWHNNKKECALRLSLLN